MLKDVFCLDTGETLGFQASNAYEAMTKLLYTLNLKRKDPNAKIRQTESGLHLYVDHSGKTYSIAV